MHLVPGGTFHGVRFALRQDLDLDPHAPDESQFPLIAAGPLEVVRLDLQEQGQRWAPFCSGSVTAESASRRML